MQPPPVLQSSATSELDIKPDVSSDTSKIALIDATKVEGMTSDRSKDELIASLMEKLRHAEVNQELFIKLQEELKQKEKQYEILRGKQKLDQESKKVAEEKLELLKQELKQKEEEMAAKDKHIRQLTKKLKQARKDWIANDYNPDAPANVTDAVPTSPLPLQTQSPNATKWHLNPEIDVKNREIKQLKEANWAHQNQNAALAQELEHLKNEHKAMLKVKEDTIRGLEKELAFVKQTHAGLRDKYLAQQVLLI